MQTLSSVALASDPTIQGFLQNSSEYSSVISSLQSEQMQRKFEFLTLVSSNLTILANANNDRRGEMFDPSGIVSKVLDLNERIVVVTTMSHSEFMKEGAPRYWYVCFLLCHAFR